MSIDTAAKGRAGPHGVKSVKRDKASFRLLSYDHRALDAAARSIIETAVASGARTSGPFPMPSEKKRLCLGRAPHVYGSSKEHMHRPTSKRLVVITGFSAVSDALSTLKLPNGVEAERVQRKDKGGV
jgi:small subunit ribosomal protein S10